MTFVVPLMILGSIYTIEQNEDFRERIDSVLNFAESQKISEIDNMTTFSFISNLQVAEKNFVDTLGIGIGLGGHETTYLRNFSHVDIHSDKWYGTNMKSE